MMSYQKPIAVGYRRVSTSEQGRSGLGLEDQDLMIRELCARRGLTLDRTFTDVESGKNDDRPELAKALARTKRVKGILVIAKLDRLARKVAFIANLMESGAPFTCADAPDDEPFIQHVKASFAEEEARKISQRTKAALAALKARGVKLGKPENLKDEHRAAGREVTRSQAKAAREAHLPEVLALRKAGLSIRATAEELQISPTTVQRILKEPGTALELVL